MFKLLLVGRKCGLSDEKLEVLAVDSLRIMRFLGVSMGDPIPDRATIARYRTQLDENTMRELFDAFHAQLAARGYVARDGQMVDSSFTLVPIQRNTRDENATIKQGDTPAKWQEDAATAKLRQKDVDARWTQKRGKNFYGYKNHICVDVGHKLIRGYATTPAVGSLSGDAGSMGALSLSGIMDSSSTDPVDRLSAHRLGRGQYVAGSAVGGQGRGPTGDFRAARGYCSVC